VSSECDSPNIGFSGIPSLLGERSDFVRWIPPGPLGCFSHRGCTLWDPESSSHRSFTQSFTILVTNYVIYYTSCLVSHALPSCALASGCYRPRDHECANITCMRAHSLKKHEIHLATRNAGEYADDKEEVTVSLVIRLRRNGSGGEGDWEIVTAQMAGASSREGMGLQGGDGAPGRRGTPGASSREARSSREAMGLQRGEGLQGRRSPERRGAPGRRWGSREARSGTDTPPKSRRPSGIAKGSRCNTAGSRV